MDSGRIPEFRSIPADSVRFHWNFQIPVDSGGIPGGIISIGISCMLVSLITRA